MSSIKGQELSEYLQSMVRAGMLRQDMAEELNTLPTKEQQRQAYRRLPQACLEVVRGVVRDMQLETAPPTPPPSDDTPAETAPATLKMARPVAPAPQLMDATHIDGHRVRIRWTPLGDNYGYRVYLAGAAGQILGLIGMVTTPGAIVNVAANGQKEAFVVVTAVRQQWTDESQPSTMVSIEPDPQNTEYSAEPLL